MSRPFAILQRGIIAGTAGGLAEIAWLALYSGVTGGNPAALARGVTTAAGASALLPASPVALGIAVHMMLALALGIALACAWQRLGGYRAAAAAGPYPFTLVALTGVWAINFFVVLPVVGPAFVTMVPYTVSLTSKLLFGLAAAAAMRWHPGLAWTSERGALALNRTGVRRDTLYRDE